MAFLKNWIVVQLVLLFSSQLPTFLDASANAYPSVKLYNSWQSSGPTELGTWVFNDSSLTTIRPILASSSTYLTFGFGLSSVGIPRGFGSEYYLVVFLLTPSLDDIFTLHDIFTLRSIKRSPIVVWCANRNSSVSWNASLEYNEGNLELKDIDGTPVWSTNTSGLNSARLNISNGGNLMLVDGKDNVIWQSFDYPTDTWLLYQNISFGKRLTSRNSSSDMNTGLYSLFVNNGRLDAYINSDPPQRYISLPVIYRDLYHYTYMDTFTTMYQNSNNSYSWYNYTESSFEFMRLESTGQLNIYQVAPNSSTFINSKNLFEGLGECDYPNVCGNYGVCSGTRQCSCPGVNSSIYFTQLQEWEPAFGCRPVTPLACEDRQFHSFLELKNVTYFNLETLNSTMDVESCKKACLDNCTCKAAFFSSGHCSLKSQVYSLKYKVGHTSLAFIKVQGIPSRNITAQDKKNSSLVPILASTLSVGIVIILVINAAYYYKVWINSNNDKEEEGDDQVIGGLKLFSFLELKSAARDFQIRLGRGGFGSVFEGDLCDGTKVAVKCLDSAGQGRKEFLAEVNTIGGTNHFNLVKLIGYCAEKSNRLLVYEYMCNGSLDKWIFNQDRAKTLSWETRRKIIVGLAKGLEYLHMQCNPNIIHFDIKPQNILLDGDFNVKISDFGLAKLIDRDQSQVVTAVKGTPGYVAPELFRGTNISVKADVFSFGIVILEIVFGRKNLDSTQSCPLIDMVKEKAENGKVEEDLTDGYNEEIQFPKEEAVKMINIAIWCLQAHNKRPSISTVLKVLEGLVDLESAVEYGFLTSPIMESRLEANLVPSTNSTPPPSSFLSGPR